MIYTTLYGTSPQFAPTEGRATPGQFGPRRIYPYVAPEIIFDLPKVTCAADVWSFGAVLREVAIGVPLFGTHPTSTREVI
jgi:serine/threonine protein kinase